jgi:ATP-dependent Clp protease ATP-binding subunit ClpA
MKACKVDLGALKEKLTNYIDNDLKTLVIDGGGEPKHTAGFQRVIQRSAHYAEGRGRPNRTRAELLVAIFAETESPAARLLSEQDMTRQTQSSSSSMGPFLTPKVIRAERTMLQAAVISVIQRVSWSDCGSMKPSKNEASCS